MGVKEHAVGLCQFKGKQDQQCQQQDMGTGFCFWHDKTIDKTGMDLTDRLEHFARSGGLLQGLQLKKANLKNVNLVNAGKATGFDLSNSDFYRANMECAHLFNADFTGASLMKANLDHANLHCANLHDANLLGVKLHYAKIDHMKIGKHVQQEDLALKAQKQNYVELARDYFEQSEEIYRNLRKTAESDGIYSLAGHFARKELIMRRKQYPLWSKKRLVSKSVDLFCGYGESPINVIGFSLLLIFVCAILFCLFGVQSNGEMIQFSSQQSFSQNLNELFSTIYFSVVTFTTLGYGDIQPVGISRLIATIEAFIGSFALALYVVVFVQKTTR